MKSSPIAPALACAALGSVAWMAGAGVAVADDGGQRILSRADMVTLTQPTEDQLEAAKAANRKFRDINVALADGFFQASPDVPGEIQLKLVALEYPIPFACMPASGPPPEGFIGNLDVWSNDEPVPFWTANAWLYFRNPAGLMTQLNPLVP